MKTTSFEGADHVLLSGEVPLWLDSFRHPSNLSVVGQVPAESYDSPILGRRI
jgi:hypothetical protein